MKSILVMLGGGVMMLSSIAHGALGWLPLGSQLQSVGASADLIGALAAGWYFGSVAMAAFGVIVLISGTRFRQQDLSGLVAVRVIAVCYVLFGFAAFFLRGFNPHFLLFVVTGVLAGGPVLGMGRRPSRADGTQR